MGTVSIAQLAQRTPTEVINMTDSISERNSGVCGSSPQAHSKISVPVKLDYAEERVVELELGSRVTAVLEIVAAERGCRVEELVLLREGEGELLTSDLMVDADYPDKCHHVHYLGEVTVIVYYQAGQHSRAFKRFEAVKDVISWAIEAFGIDGSLATELVLVRHGQKDELPEREHIGHLTGKGCELALDLVRGDIANGSSS